MKKSELKTGMLVEVKCGYVYFAINDTLVRENGTEKLSNYNEDLLNSNRPQGDFDIVKVSKKLDGWDTVPSNWTLKTLNRNLLWERPEEKEECIDWSRNPIVEGLSGVVIRVTGAGNEDSTFSGVVIEEDSYWDIGIYSDTWAKSNFKLIKY